MTHASAAQPAQQPVRAHLPRILGLQFLRHGSPWPVITYDS
jgi:hypothetical protein